MIKERFKDFSEPNYFSRVDTSHPLELHIGLDEKGRKSIELRDSFKPRKVISSGAIEVNQYTKPEYNTIRFSLNNNEVSGLFYKFCDDLIEQTNDIKDRETGYQSIVNRYYQWKKLFASSSKNILSESEIMGLIGEILFLSKKLASEIGIENALYSWTGQELTHKDFSYNDTWYEVKTVNTGKNSVKISSLDQLDGDVDGELAVYSLEKMSETYEGITLNQLIVDTIKLFNIQDDKDKFINKVATHGYEYNNYYDGFVYMISGFYRYNVTSEFPKLTKKMVPNEIVKASYEIDLSQLSGFLKEKA